METDAWGDPNYFVLLDHVVIDPKFFSPLVINRIIYIVEFQAAGIEEPSAEPICVYHYAGSRRFIWRDKFYGECDLPYRQMIQQMVEDSQLPDHSKVLAMLARYGRSPAPNFDSTHDKTLADLKKSKQRFYRAIYAIE